MTRLCFDTSVSCAAAPPLPALSRILSLAALVWTVLLASAGTVQAKASPPPAEGPADGRTAPLLEGMAAIDFMTHFKDPVARQYFDQGMVLAWGFNHAEAERSFLEAARREPGCGICYWGAALVLGPNLNAPMDPEIAPRAWEWLGKAQDGADEPGAEERALIAALAARYRAEAPEDRSELDAAYAAAMREVAGEFPRNPHVLTLFAEALMDLHPWDFWTKAGDAQPWTPEVLATLEAALAVDPQHPGANHLYIHAIEASATPERAEVAADRLGKLAPGAGHLVHMPAHIYLRVGRYQDAYDANVRAAAADDAYIQQCHAQGLYPVAYVPHNHHFLWAAASFEGRSAAALEAASHMSAHVDAELMRQPGLSTLQHFWVMPLYVHVRFGHWEEILAAPRPADDLLYPTGVWHYARGLALSASGKLPEAEAELAALSALADNEALDEVTIWDINTSRALLEVAREILAGEILARQGNAEQAITHLRRGVELEDALNYDEPASWHQPVRLVLGAVLLAAGRAQEAEAAYREDLERHPENGWALFGLYQSLRAQGDTEGAADAEARFLKTWIRADVELASSRF